MIETTLPMLAEEASLLRPLFDLHAHYVAEREAADEAMDQQGIDWAATADRAVMMLVTAALTEAPDFNELREHLNGPDIDKGYFGTPAGFMVLCEARSVLPELDRALQPQSY